MGGAHRSNSLSVLAEGTLPSLGSRTAAVFEALESLGMEEHFGQCLP